MNWFALPSVILLIILVSYNSWGQVRCESLFAHSTTTRSNSAFEDQMQAIERALDLLQSSDLTPSNEEYAAFIRNNSSFKALTWLNRTYQSELTDFWALLMQRTFSDRALETGENILRAELAFEDYYRYFNNQQSLRQLLSLAKKTKTQRLGKLGLIRLLKGYSLFLSHAMGREIDLLKESDLLELFGVDSRNELVERVKELEDLHESFLGRIEVFATREVERTAAQIQFELTEVLFGNRDFIPFDRNDRGFYQRNGSQKEVESLIKALAMPPEREAFFLNDLSITNSQDSNLISGVDTHRTNVLIALRGAFETLAEVPFIRLTVDGMRRRSSTGKPFDSKIYLRVRKLIQDTEYTRTMIEERMNNYLDQASAINQRIEDIRLGINDVLHRYPQWSESVEGIRDSLVEIEVRDFDQDLSSLSQQIFQVEVAMNHLREQIADSIRKEGIDQFIDLNNRWDRFISGKKYELSGIDYKYVVFNQTVLDAFRKDHLLWSRYMITLQKSYVSLKKSSGLRRLPLIHHDMRDIKLIKAGGKIRIVGKLIGDTIYFFSVFNGEAYQDGPMSHLVETYNPH